MYTGWCVVTGQNHVIVNTAAVPILFAGLTAIKDVVIMDISPYKTIMDYLFFTGGMNIVFYIVVAICLYVVGSLLPDIDNEKSILGKIVYVPLEHRTWTHTIYIPLTLFIASIWCRLLLFLGLGYFMHLFIDSFSRCGVCWFYPISKYKHFGTSGAKIKNGHFFYLYKTRKSEIVVTAIFIALSVPALVYALTAHLMLAA